MQTLSDFIPDRLNPFDESPETNLVEDIIIKEEYEQASSLLKEKLTDLEEDIFVEYGYNSSYKEISMALNVPSKCVDNALTRIRKKVSEVYVQYSMQETILIRQKIEEKLEPKPQE